MQYFVFVFNKHICYTTEFKLYGLISSSNTIDPTKYQQQNYTSCVLFKSICCSAVIVIQRIEL